MSVVAAAIIGSTVVGAYSASESSKAISESAARGTDAQLTASRENIAFQQEVFDQGREDSAPWREAGAQALTQLETGIASGAFDPSQFNFVADPGYQFRLSEGIRARDASASARGRLQSGAQDKAISRYAQDYASGEYGAAYQRNVEAQQQNYNVLAGVAQSGQLAIGQDSASRNVMAGNVGSSIIGTGSAIAAGEAAAGSARASAYTGIAAAGQQGIQNYLTYRK